MGPSPLCTLEDKTAALKETPQTECKTGQARREMGGGPWGGAHVNEVHAKDTGGREAAGWWLGARPNLEPHFHMQVSLRLLRAASPLWSFRRKGCPPSPREGGGRWLWAMGCVPLAGRARFPSKSITGPVSEQAPAPRGRVNDVGETYMWGCPHMAVWL